MFWPSHKCCWIFCALFPCSNIANTPSLSLCTATCNWDTIPMCWCWKWINNIVTCIMDWRFAPNFKRGYIYIYYNKNQFMMYPCLEMQVNCFCVRIFHESEGRMKYLYTKTMNLIFRQGYIMNWFLFLCRTTSVLIILMFNIQF